ncbi:hypothetical protein EH31_15815 [Erythrobacter longus]|uniref:Uncharacterized protein n=2 Tax=Erythrobacter longus TaxID=1044 RepID=A0A074MTC7_ERYLO|nr:hypothetical protein EH31_15815 [Erythrobacter longus]
MLAMVQAAPVTFDSNAYYEAWSSKEVRAKIEECGFEEVRVYKNKAKATVVQVKDTSASDAELRCAAERIDKTFYGYEFSPELAERFFAIKAEVARPRQIAQARARFAREPEKGPPPERLTGETDAALASRIETFCGPKAKGALDAGFGPAGMVTISPEWMGPMQGNLDAIADLAETMGCLMQAAVIADLEVGFVGNDVAAGSAD